MIDLLIIVAAIATGAFLKGATGTGLPQIAIPVMAVFVGVEHAVVVMALPGVVTNGWLFWRYRKYLALTRDLPVLLGTGMAGAIIGTMGLKAFDAKVLSLALALVVGAYLCLFVARAELVLVPKLTRWLSPPVGLASGVLQGSTGISGPLLSTYLHGFRLHREAFVLSQVVLFQVYSVVQLVTLLHLGLFTPARVGHSVLALLPIMLMIPLGARYASRISLRTFDMLVLIILAGSGIKLLYDALAA
jgi:uncharacterized protein